MAMRLKRFAIKNLFGIFNHEISLRLSDGITIVHAPNGYGKTVILRLVNSFFSGSMKIFREVEFDSIEIEFETGELVTIEQFEITNANTRPGLRGGSSKGYRVELAGSPLPPWEPFAPPQSDSLERPRFGPSAIDRFVPHLVRVGPREWRDTSVGDKISMDAVMERYWQMIPENYRQDRGGPDWLQQIRSSIKCQLIETQRLIAKRKSSREYSEEEADIEFYARLDWRAAN